MILLTRQQKNESLEKSSLSIDGATETVKHEIKNQEGGFLSGMMAPMAASLIALMASPLIQSSISSLINAITGKGNKGGFLPLLALPLMIKVMSRKGVMRAREGVRSAGRGYNNRDTIFQSGSIL